MYGTDDIDGTDGTEYGRYGKGLLSRSGPNMGRVYGFSLPMFTLVVEGYGCESSKMVIYIGRGPTKQDSRKTK